MKVECRTCDYEPEMRKVTRLVASRWVGTPNEVYGCPSCGHWVNVRKDGDEA